MSISLEELRAIVPLAEHPEIWIDPLNEAAREFDILSPYCLAAWLANVAEESSQLNDTIENLNYSADGLKATFPSHFAITEFSQFAHQPQKIANRVYSNRMGNGSEASGDGWNFRGRGLPMLTGRSAYEAASEALGLDLVNHPELLMNPVNSARCAGWFWEWKKCSEPANQKQFRIVVRLWNGGLNGIVQREAFYEKALGVLP